MESYFAFFFPQESPWITWVILVCTALLGLYLYSTWTFGFFKDRGIPYMKPYPLVGSVIPFLKKGMQVVDTEQIQQHGKVFGVFSGRQPLLVVADPKLLKQVFVKDFDVFTNRTNSTSSTTNKYFKLLLTMIKDDHWKSVRNTITPAFSTGKLKMMTVQINATAKQLTDHLHVCAVEGKVFDAYEYAGAFTMDTIARVAFGIHIDSQADKNNEFVLRAKDFQVTNFMSPKVLIFFFFPFIARLFERYNMGLIPPQATEFFVSTVKEAAKRRQEGAESPPDLLQLMLDAHNMHDEEIDADLDHEALKSGKKRGLTEDEVLAQGLLVFIAGFDTTAITLTFTMYNLAINPDCQDRLRRDIQDVLEDREDVKPEDLQKMPYIKQVVEETLRMYPLAFRLAREASRDVEIAGVNIPKGTQVQAPVWHIHHDPEIYPDPDTFNPDRFSPEEKAKRDPVTYLPFGMGPRNCIGMRLALMETQIALARLLHKHKLIQCEETEVPVQIKPNVLRPKKPIQLKIIEDYLDNM